MAPLALAIPELSLASWAGIMATAALVGTCWSTVKGWFQQIADLVICRVVVKDEASRAVMATIWAKGKRSPLGVKLYGGARSFVAPRKRVETVAYEAISASPILVLFGYTPVVLKHANNGDGKVHDYDSTPGLVHLWFIRGTLNVDRFVQDAVTTFNTLTTGTEIRDGERTKRRRFNVNRIGRPAGSDHGGLVSLKARGESLSPCSINSDDILKRLQHNELRLLTLKPDDLIEQMNEQAPFDLYPYPATQLALLPEIDDWLKYAEFFRQKGIPHRMGVLCFGRPGTGKSTFVRSVAIRFDLPLYTFDLSGLDNQTFAVEWRTVQANTPAIVLIEDIDAIWNGRTWCADTAANRDHLTFDCLLNTISGVGSSDGILLFVTTNHVESLDPALGVPIEGQSKSTRPGRLDRMLWFGPMEEDQRRALASFILSDSSTHVEDTVRAGEGETAAQFQDRCAQLALRLWNEGHRPSIVVKPALPVPHRASSINELTNLIAKKGVGRTLIG